MASGWRPEGGADADEMVTAVALQLEVPLSVAERMIQLSDALRAEQAESLGIVSVVVYPDGRLDVRRRSQEET